MPRNFTIDNSAAVEKKFVNLKYFSFEVKHGRQDSFFANGEDLFSGGSTIIPSGYDDAFTNPIPIYNNNILTSFNFGNENFSYFRASSNGFITFKNVFSDSHFPDFNKGSFIVAPFWFDLKTGASTGRVSVSYFSGMDPPDFEVSFAVKWNQMNYPYTSTTYDCDFQAIFYKNGDIKFVYNKMSVGVQSTRGAAIGLSFDGTSFLSIQDLINFNASSTVQNNYLTYQYPVGSILELDHNTDGYKYILFKKVNQQIPFAFKTPGVISMKKNVPHNITVG